VPPPAFSMVDGMKVGRKVGILNRLKYEDCGAVIILLGIFDDNNHVLPVGDNVSIKDGWGVVLVPFSIGQYSTHIFSQYAFIM
jgi:hypothetical protein